MRVNLTPKSYFSTYIKKPCSKDLSTSQKALAVIATVALTILTAGLIFIVPCILSALNKRKIANMTAKTKSHSPFIDSDIKEVVASMRTQLQGLGVTSVRSAQCILKTDFHAHTDQNNFTMQSENPLDKLEDIQNIHTEQCKKLPYGTPIKTEWAWIIQDLEYNRYELAGDLIPPNRGTSLEFGKSGSQVNFRI